MTEEDGRLLKTCSPHPIHLHRGYCLVSSEFLLLFCAIPTSLLLTRKGWRSGASETSVHKGSLKICSPIGVDHCNQWSILAVFNTPLEIAPDFIFEVPHPSDVEQQFSETSRLTDAMGAGPVLEKLSVASPSRLRVCLETPRLPS